jgi:hypothetical protein
MTRQGIMGLAPRMVRKIEAEQRSKPQKRTRPDLHPGWPILRSIMQIDIIDSSIPLGRTASLLLSAPGGLHVDRSLASE